METVRQRLVLWFSALVGGLGVIALGLYIDFTASDWEPLLVGLGALLALVGLLGWRRAPERFRWLSAGLGSVGVFSMVVFAAFHWWLFVFVTVLVLQMIVNIAVISGDHLHSVDRFSAALWSVPRRVAREAAKPIALHEFDDPDAVKVYSDRGRAARVAFPAMGLSLALGGLTTYFSANPTSSTHQASGILACDALTVLFGVIGLNALNLLIYPRPLVIIGRIGIVLRGVSRMRWSEIIAVGIQTPPKPTFWLSKRKLTLMVANPAALRARQPWWIRLLIRLAILDDESPMTIYERLLSVPLEAVEAMILPHVEGADDTSRRRARRPRRRSGAGLARANWQASLGRASEAE